MNLNPHMEKLGGWLFAAYVMALGVPLFIFPEHRATNLSVILDPASPAALDRQPLRIHWIAVFAAAVCGYLFLQIAARRRFGWPGESKLVLGLFLVFSLSLVAGLLVQPDRLNVVYFLQTVLPFVGFSVGVRVADSLANVRANLLRFVVATTVSIVMILALALRLDVFSSGIVAANTLARMVPQLRDYFPFVVVASVSIAVSILPQLDNRWHRTLILVAVAIHVLFYSFVWSRMAVLMLGVAALCFFVLSVRSSRTGWFRNAIVAVCVLVVAGLLAAQLGQLRSRWEGPQAHGTTIEQSDQRRAAYGQEALRAISKSPFLGEMFIPNWERDPHPARLLRIPRIYKAHNQYLDYGLRGGLPAIFLLGWIALVTTRSLRNTLASPKTVPALRYLAMGIASALAAVVVGNLTQLFLLQAQPASLAWMLIGISLRLQDLVSSDQALTGQPGDQGSSPSPATARG